MIGEPKLDDTFPTSQFVIDNFPEPFRKITQEMRVVYYFMLKIT